MDKYPNVFLTQGLMDLGKMGLVDENLEKPTRKIKVISQLVDDEYPLPDDGEEPVGFDKDPWAYENEINDEDDIDGLFEDDLMDGENLQGNEPLNTRDYDNISHSDNFNGVGEDNQSSDWQSELKKWFRQREQ